MRIGYRLQAIGVWMVAGYSFLKVLPLAYGLQPVAFFGHSLKPFYLCFLSIIPR